MLILLITVELVSYHPVVYIIQPVAACSAAVMPLVAVLAVRLVLLMIVAALAGVVLRVI